MNCSNCVKLNERIEELSSIINNCHNIIDNCNKENTTLKTENEVLKNSNKQLKECVDEHPEVARLKVIIEIHKDRIACLEDGGD